VEGSTDYENSGDQSTRNLPFHSHSWDTGLFQSHSLNGATGMSYRWLRIPCFEIHFGRSIGGHKRRLEARQAR